jgi:hypothetical protein
MHMLSVRMQLARHDPPEHWDVHCCSCEAQFIPQLAAWSRHDDDGVQDEASGEPSAMLPTSGPASATCASRCGGATVETSTDASSGVGSLLPPSVPGGALESTSVRVEADSN